MCAHVISLAVERGGIVDREEHVQQLTITYLVGIKGDTYHLNMSGIAVADLAIRGIVHVTSHIT